MQRPSKSVRRTARWLGFVLMCAALASYAPGFAAAALAGPFSNMSGSWSGAGVITLASGSRERIRCRANYGVAEAGNTLALVIRCASDSYKFELRGNAIHDRGGISGTWSEATRNAAGQIIGKVSGNQIHARTEGQTFAALLSMSTQGNRQSISIRSPGSEMSDVTISLSRGSH